MEEFNKLSKNPGTLKLKDLKPGSYPLISLRKITTKYGDSTIAKLQLKNEEYPKEYYLAKKHGDLSDEAIKSINKKIMYLNIQD